MKTELKGAGDLIARFTKAGRIDRAAEWIATTVFRREGCGCPERQARLNSMLPFGPYRWPKLTIAIPLREDWYGFWATWHGLVHQVRAAGLQDHVELIVIDQSPEHEDAQMVKQTVNTVAAKWEVDPFHRAVNRGGPIEARYLPMTEIMGTAAAKQFSVHSARGEWVLVLDSHILLDERAIARVYNWLRKPANRHSDDLYHGVLLYDNHREFFTQLEIWNEDGSPRIGDDGVFGQWATDPRGRTADQKPFEIPASGGWAILARRQAFLQVGFHPLMRGFGGEEGFVAERWRRAGRKVMCHPAIRGVHRFGRRNGDQYTVTFGEKLRNHVIGWLDLGFDLEELRTLWHRKLAADDLDATIARTVAEWEAAHGGQPTGQPTGQKPDRAALRRPARRPEQPAERTIEGLYQFLCSEPSDINEHLPTLRKYAEQSRHVTEFGTRAGVSTAALLAAQPDVLVSYDVAPQCACSQLKKLRGKTQLSYLHGPEIGNTITIDPIPETDLLFIDTIHTANHLREELRRHAASTRKWIILHDTVTFGDIGEGHTKAQPQDGLLTALGEFLRDNRDYWAVEEVFENNNGLTVLKRIL